MASPPDSDLEFSGTERFCVLRRIGSGGIGLVYEAIDRDHGTRVAVKTLQRLGSDALLRFKNEFRMLQGMHHRNLVRLGELFEHRGQWFFTMELIDGVDFMSHVATTTRTRDQVSTMREPSQQSTASTDLAVVNPRELDPADPGPALPVAHEIHEDRLRASLRQLAEGLIVLHGAGMIHRDIKPQNVMVSGERVVLLDFGLVSEVGPSSLELGMVVGTPSYMAPEQAVGKPISPASDWYGVGSMLYEALTGVRPFRGPPSVVMAAKQSMDPVPPARVAQSLNGGVAQSLNQGVPADLDQLCMELLARDPEARPTGPEVLARLGGPGRRRYHVVRASSNHQFAETPLVGRGALLDILHAAFERRRPGRPGAVLVHGASGMGKTALIEHFAAHLKERDHALVLRGRCYERESVPYKAFDGIIDELARHLRQPESDGHSLIPQRIGPLARLFPVLGDLGPSDPDDLVVRDPAELRRRAFVALKLLLASVAARRPLVIIIDDLQWGDLDSAALLSELLARPNAPGMLVIASYRSEEARSALVTAFKSRMTRALEMPARAVVSAGRGLDDRAVPETDGPEPIDAVDSGAAADTGKVAGESDAVDAVDAADAADVIQVIEVGPLGHEDSRTLAHARLQALSGSVASHLSGSMAGSMAGSVAGSVAGTSAGAPAGGPARQSEPLSDALADAIADESQGSPFFVGELARYWATSDTTENTGSTVGISLDEMLAKRRQRLGRDARAVLDIVAIAGQPIARGLALAAAGLSAQDHAVIDVLRAELLVRSRGPGLEDAIESYHDRIREVIAALLASDEIISKHKALARELERAPSPDVEMLTACYMGAGEPQRAADYAMRAAQHAERALAFGRAARMYRLALDMAGPSWDGARRRDVLLRLGAALVNAGRGTEAAAEFLAAASAAPAAEVLALERAAAAQLLRSGHIDDGLELLGRMLTAVGLRVPASNHAALASLALHRLGLRMRGLHYRPRTWRSIPARLRQRMDICWTGAIGLSMVDPVRGADFGTRCLLMALAAGDEVRISRSLSMEACQVATGGSKTAARAGELARLAGSIAERLRDPKSRGLAVFAHGAIATLTGRWRHAVAECERAEAIFRRECVGTAWEIATLRTFMLTALYYMGEWSSMHERAEIAVSTALGRGDLYTAADLVSFATYSRLAQDDVAGARRSIERATVDWTVRGYHVQHYLNLSSHLQVALYTGEGEHAWQQLNDAWPALRRSLLGHVQLLRIEMEQFRARCALAHAEHAPRSLRAELLELAASASRTIERERMPWASAIAAMTRAGVAASQGDSPRAAALLESAAVRLDDTDMSLFAAAARWRLGELVGGTRGAELIAAAGERMRAQGIANPAALASMLAPGFAARS